MNLSTTPTQAELPAVASVQNGPARECPNLATVDVGENLRAAQNELDDAITELGWCAERSMANGDPTGARIYTDRMYAAIASRTPEHQARLTAAADARIADELTFSGDWARRRVG